MTCIALNRYPDLKAFLMQGEAEYYEGVSVEFVKGRKAVLTIYDGDKEVEQIDLQEFNDKEELHALLQEKGYKLRDDLPKSLEELRAENEVALEVEKKQRQQKKEERIQQAKERRQKRMVEAAAAEAANSENEGIASEL